MGDKVFVERAKRGDVLLTEVSKDHWCIRQASEDADGVPGFTDQRAADDYQLMLDAANQMAREGRVRVLASVPEDAQGIAYKVLADYEE